MVDPDYSLVEHPSSSCLETTSKFPPFVHTTVASDAEVVIVEIPYKDNENINSVNSYLSNHTIALARVVSKIAISPSIQI